MDGPASQQQQQMTYLSPGGQQPTAVITSSFHSPSLHFTEEFFLTSEQQRVLNQALPKGYSFQFASKPARSKHAPVPPSFQALSKGSSESLQFRTSGSHVSSSEFGGGGKPSRQPSRGGDYSTSNDGNHFSMQFDQNNQEYHHNLPPPPQPAIIDLSESFQRSTQGSKLPSGQQKKRAPSGGSSRASNGKSSPTNRGGNGKRRSEAGKSVKANGGGGGQSSHQNASASINLSAEEQKSCLQVLQQLQRHRYSPPFMLPVDPVKQGCADYLMVIRDPMDLSTVERNLRFSEYHSTTQFAADIRKIWNNSYLYNSRESQIYSMTVEMDKFFEKKYKEMEQSVFGESQNIPYYVKMLAQAIKGGQQISPHSIAASVPASARGGASASQGQKKGKNPAPSKMDTPMTMQEKKALGQNILLLPPDCLRGVWEIVQSDSNEQYDDQILQFDIDKLSIRKARELELYVRQKMVLASKRKANKVQDKSLTSEKKAQQNASAFDETEPDLHSNHNDYSHSASNHLGGNRYSGMQSSGQSSYHHSEMQQSTGGSFQTNGMASTTTAEQFHSRGPMDHSKLSSQGDYGGLSRQQSNTSYRKNDDADSDSSFISGDSDSQNC